MARSIAEIYNQIIEEKENNVLLKEALQPMGNQAKYVNFLATLSSTSKAAIWQLWAFAMAAAINIHEQLWDVFKKDLEEIAESGIFGTPAWYEKKAFEFQVFQPLVFKEGEFTYATVDPEAQIVKHAALEEQPNGTLILKLAKEEGDVLTPLKQEQNENELESFFAYIKLIKPAGIVVDVLSHPGDRIRVYATVYYDSILPQEKVQENVEAAIKNYFKNLDFNGIAYTQKITDAIQAAVGVKDVSIVKCEARTYGSNSLNNFNNTEPLGVAYRTYAGYIVPEDEGDEKFDKTITYKPLA